MVRSHPGSPVFAGRRQFHGKNSPGFLGWGLFDVRIAHGGRWPRETAGCFALARAGWGLAKMFSYGHPLAMGKHRFTMPILGGIGENLLKLESDFKSEVFRIFADGLPNVGQLSGPSFAKGGNVALAASASW